MMKFLAFVFAVFGARALALDIKTKKDSTDLTWQSSLLTKHRDVTNLDQSSEQSESKAFESKLAKSGVSNRLSNSIRMIRNFAKSVGNFFSKVRDNPAVIFVPIGGGSLVFLLLIFALDAYVIEAARGQGN